MLSPILFQFLVFTGYIMVTISNYGVLPSISNSFYRMGENYRRPVFFAFMCSLGISCFFLGHELFALGGSCLCFTGVAAAYKDKITRTVHYVGAWGGIGFILLGLLVQGSPEPLIGTVLVAVIASLFDMPNKTWWIEVWSFVYIEMGLITDLIT